MPIRILLIALSLIASLAGAAQVVSRFDVLITELLPDPSPSRGLPAAEFIEVRNVSSVPVNMSGWKLSNASSSATIGPNVVLLPDSMLILCATGAVAQYQSFGRTTGIGNFPALDNEGGIVVLQTATGTTVHAVAYSADLYGSSIKSEGGWSLEIVDGANPCGPSNWKASIDGRGGTPGRVNSVMSLNPDEVPPQLKRSYALDSNTLVLVFNESLDSSSAANPTRYTLSNGLSVKSATPLPPLFQSVTLHLNGSLSALPSSIIVANIRDCSGNEIGAFNKTGIGLPVPVVQGDVIINELLFNPPPGASDFVEVHNPSGKIIDAAGLYIATRSPSGMITSAKALFSAPYYLFPGDYLVITEDGPALERHFFVKNRDAVRVLPSLPSYPDSEGTVVLADGQGRVIDEVTYDESWHFGLIKEPEGIALERMNPALPSGDRMAWHSAAETAGFGTPGYQNSQLQQAVSGEGIKVSPTPFSPDNDGYEDVTTIHYGVAESGFVANIFILDVDGRQVRHLVKSALLSREGAWTWDGLGEGRKRLAPGPYIIYSELFNLKGKRLRYKNLAVLAGKGQ